MDLFKTQTMQNADSGAPERPVVLPREGRVGDRFLLVRRLGEGGFGVVYEAEDRLDGSRIALKVLRRGGGEWSDRFKREFRALHDLQHPNLISLYELLYIDGQWLFTMELLHGVGLTEHLRARSAAEPPEEGADRVRLAFAQLFAGLETLHVAGKVHRDVKPSNVIVTREGRVVLLDLGLVIDADRSDAISEERVIGTPAYMAPEQAAMEEVGPAADLYGAGTMLYEVLAGRLPFDGTALNILLKKRLGDAVPPFSEGAIPDDLASLALDLLKHDPAARPTAAEAVARLAVDPHSRPVDSYRAVRPRATALVGREAELEWLERTFSDLRSGQPRLVEVTGVSGIGKSTLVGRFIEQLRRDHGALVLRSRCYERESVPFKAFDDLVDGLVNELASRSREDRAHVIPPDMAPLERMFPVLRAFATEPELGDSDPTDLKDLRQRAFASLGKLLAAVGESQPVALWFDDAQWADAESASLLETLLRADRPARLLVILSHRALDAGRSPFLDQIAAIPREKVQRDSMALAALSPDEARRLAHVALPEERRQAAYVEAVVRESEGSPFFIGELAFFLRAHSLREEQVSSLDVSLEQVILARIHALPDGAQRLLEALAVGGQPVPQRVALRACELDTEGAGWFAVLSAAQLIRRLGTDADVELAVYHDRIADTLLASIASETRASYHVRLAQALESFAGADPETIVVHYRAGGDPRRAARHAVRAAELAASALAFERAARLYEDAMEMGSFDPAERRGLIIAMGHAFANAGQGRRAADAYLEAARNADVSTALDLRRRAGEQLLRSGYVDEGFAVGESVLEAIGERPSRTPRAALMSVIARRLFLAVRGYGFRPKDESEVPAVDLRRVDACWSAAVVTGVIDTLRAADVQARHMLFALRVGEPYRVARALCLETAHAASQGEPARKSFETLAARTRELAAECGRPHAIALAELAEGMGAWFMWQLRPAADRCTRAEHAFRHECTGAAWEAGTARIFAYLALASAGDLRELRSRISLHGREGRDRSDHYAAWIPLSGFTVLAQLAEGREQEVREGLDQALRQWSKSVFTVQHHWAAIARSLCDLYVGRETESLPRLSAEEKEQARAQLFRVEVVRIHFRFMLAQCLIASAEGGASEPLRRAARCADRMGREAAQWAAPMAALCRAGIAWRSKRPETAVRELRSAADDLASWEMSLFAAVARRRLGRILGGDEGRTLVVGADAFMREQGVVDPNRLARTLAAGYDDLG